MKRDVTCPVNGSADSDVSVVGVGVSRVVYFEIVADEWA